MANKITTIVDFQVENAKSGLSGLKTSLDEAEGFTGKLKAGFGGLGDTVKGALIGPGGLAVAGGAIAAAGGLALDQVSKFSDLGVQIGHMADATGLSVDQASRWTEIAGDIGIGPDALESAIGKMNKTAGNSPEKFDAAGIAIGHMKDGTVDANTTLLNTIDRLNGIKDPAKRAALGAQLFGKGWQGVAELIGEGSDQIVQDLKNVDSAKVFDEDKVAKARGYRDAMANLHDSLEGISIVIGEQLAPNLTELITDLSTVTSLVTVLKPTWHIPLLDSIGQIRAGWDYFFHDDAPKVADDAIKSVNDSLDGGEKSWETYGATSQAQVTETERETRALGRATGDLSDPIDVAKRAAQMMTDSIKLGLDKDKAALDNLKGGVDDHQAWTNLELTFDDVKAKGVDMTDAVTKHTDDAKRKTLEYSSALDGLKNDVINYATEVLKLPVEQVTKIVAAVDPQSVADAEAVLAALTRNRNVSVDIVGKGGAGFGNGLSGARAAGGPVSAGGNYLVGEKGPEVVHMGGNGTVIPNGALGGITNNFYGITDPRELARQQAREIGWALRST